MRCKTCDYPLWNLKARNCPECGTAFVPAGFDFVVNSVQFCCPHCDQAYYGTGQMGHLAPNEFNCVSCGQRITMNEMVLRPTQGVREEQTQVDRMPWLERKQRGWFKAWLHTVGKSVAAPTSLMRGTPPESSMPQAWGFAALTFFMVYAAGAGVPILGIAAYMALSGNPQAAETLGIGAIIIVAFPAALLLFTAIWGLTAHGLLRLTGVVQHPIRRTYHALLYGAGALTPLAIPCVGPYCGTFVVWILWLIVAVLLMAAAHNVHGGRAAFATLTFPLMLLALVAAAYFALVASLMGGFGVGPIKSTTPPTFEINLMTQQVIAHAQLHDGPGPQHASQLVSELHMGASMFVASNSATDPTQIMVGDIALNTLDSLPPNRQRAATHAAADAMPQHLVAHRLGDFVFTYHGIHLTTCDPGLWIVVLSPDPAAAAGTAPPPRAAGLAGGGIQLFNGDYAEALHQQNQLRIRNNLSPLPDVTTITHERPAAVSPSDARGGRTPA